MKYSQWIGVAAAILLIISCFMPWTWYPDLGKSFNGFYSEGNIYGKPGKLLAFLSVLLIALYLTPRVWAKRWNMFNGCFTLAYTIKTFILFTGCYGGVCPEKLAGIWIMLGCSLAIMLTVLVPDTPLKGGQASKEKTNE